MQIVHEGEVCLGRDEGRRGRGEKGRGNIRGGLTFCFRAWQSLHAVALFPDLPLGRASLGGFVAVEGRGAVSTPREKGGRERAGE